MARYELLMPKMGESVAEATVIKWVKNIGDAIEADEPVLEIATDKVDSEVPSPVAGKLLEQRFGENDVVQVGDVVAVMETDEGSGSAEDEDAPEAVTAVPIEDTAQEGGGREGKKQGEEENPGEENKTAEKASADGDEEKKATVKDEAALEKAQREEGPENDPIPGLDLLKGTNGEVKPHGESGRFYSPLVRSIAENEGIGMQELENIPGSGAEGRVTKNDVLAYLEKKKTGGAAVQAPDTPAVQASPAIQAPPVKASPGDEIIEMDRMRRLISEHMVMSKHVSPHVCSFVEADVTNMVRWREKIKTAFEKQEGEKITYTPIFIEAVTKAIRDFPMVNVSVDGTKIIKRKNINIGLATALPSGNLIVPVIRNADQMSLVGLTKAVNDLSGRARENNLQPDEVREGTFTVTNVGTFGNVMGTPIINQPQVAILALGAIRKRPAVLETPEGDVIAIRHMMFLSLSYDHRVVDGVLGGSFLRRIADYLEAFDPERKI